jgi:hypothetical protein
MYNITYTFNISTFIGFYIQKGQQTFIISSKT